ncbi:MAG TPA: CoA transferase [Dehalococcoidia bacterium]|nr:CoA transferase [Dehalococcoidia bacterium]
MPALEDLKILDLTQYEAGTSCTQMLAWLGAEVVKIEQPGLGDPGRRLRPRGGNEDALYFLTYNANKRSVTLNLRSEEGKRLFLELVPQFDVVVENFSLGTMEKLGLGYETLKQIHPGVIYATVKGFGTTGPYSPFHSYEMIAQAAGGAFSVTGMAGGVPLRSGGNLGDTGSGMILMGGILAAYIQRLKTGEGQHVEVAQQEAVLNQIRTALSFRERTGEPVPRRGNRATVPTDLYPCAPGGDNDYVYMHVPTRHMLDALFTAIGRPELVVDPRFDSEEARAKHQEELWDIIADWTRQRTKYEVMELLGPVDVPCSAVLDSCDIWQDRHLNERGYIRTMHHPVRGDWQFPGMPIRLSRSSVELQRSPLLGEHTQEVLAEKLGVNSDEVRSLHEAGVV